MSTIFKCGVPVGRDLFRWGAKRVAGLLAGLRGEQGSVAIEGAVSLMVLVTITVGFLELCVMSYTYSVMAESAREGVRYAIVHGTDSSSCSGPSTGCDATAANVKSDVAAYAANFSTRLSNMVVTVTYPDGTSTGTSRVQVSIRETYQPAFHVPGVTPTLTFTSAGRILY
jgi:hypothetical protein